MLEIGDRLLPREVESDGCRSIYKIVAIEGDFVDVMNLNVLGSTSPERRLASEFVTEADWDAGVKAKGYLAMNAEVRGLLNVEDPNRLR